ncbi:MAG TPA: BON domain-containing protein [Bryobacteraceae bacterium]
MRPIFGRAMSGTLLIFSLACNQSDREKAKERGAEARQETQQAAARAAAEARKLGEEAKREANSQGKKIDLALQPDDQAAAKLDHAAMLAKVKTKLASNVGLATLADVDVDSSGHVVTLRGTVASDAQRQEAGQAVAQIEGVTKVVNDLKVQP